MSVFFFFACELFALLPSRHPPYISVRFFTSFSFMDLDKSSPENSPPDHHITPTMATMVANGSAPNMPGSVGPAGKRYRPAPAKTFQCRGYGDCRMVFSRSEHLARHIRFVLLSCLLIRVLTVLASGNTRANDRSRVIVANSFRDWTTCASMRRRCTPTSRTRTSR